MTTKKTRALRAAALSALITTTPGWKKFETLVARCSLYRILTHQGQRPVTRRYPGLGYLLLLEHALGKHDFRQLCPLVMPLNDSFADASSATLPDTHLLQNKGELCTHLWRKYCELQRQRAYEHWPFTIGPVIDQVLRTTIAPVLPEYNFWPFCQAYLNVRYGLPNQRPVTSIRKMVNLAFAEAKAMAIAGGNREGFGNEAVIIDCAEQVRTVLANQAVVPFLRALASNFSQDCEPEWAGILKKALRLAAVRPTEPDLAFDTCLADLISARAADALEKEGGIITFSDLRGVTAQDLLAIPGFGINSVAAVVEALRKVCRAVAAKKKEGQRQLKQEKTLARKQQKQYELAPQRPSPT